MQHRLPRKWILFPLALLAIGIFMAQRGAHKHPSPADPGMRLATDKPKSPTNGHGIEAPDPQVDDPTAGDIPINNDEEDDEEDDVLPQPPPPTESFRATGFEMMRVAEGSIIGKSGGWVMLIKGQGFMESEVPPIVHVGDSLLLSKTWVAAGGSELYVILDDAQANLIQRLTFDEISVQNPGGMNRNPAKWAKLTIRRDEWTTKLNNAQQMRFERTQGRIQIAR